jgi:hypothetical protein
MTDRIELTDDERAAAIHILRASSDDNYGYGCFGATVDELIDAVNGVRLGDPIGTVRHSLEDGLIGVRVRAGNGMWRIVSTRTGSVIWADACDFFVAYRPPRRTS